MSICIIASLALANTPIKRLEHLYQKLEIAREYLRSIISCEMVPVVPSGLIISFYFSSSRFCKRWDFEAIGPIYHRDSKGFKRINVGVWTLIMLKERLKAFFRLGRSLQMEERHSIRPPLEADQS